MNSAEKEKRKGLTKPKHCYSAYKKRANRILPPKKKEEKKKEKKRKQ